MKNKLLLIIGIYYAMAIISCGCKETKTPYSDFKSISIQDGTWTEDGWIAGSYLDIFQEDIEFISSNSFNFFNSAYAFTKQGDCSPGYLENKYPIEKITVTCSQLFYDSIPAGNSLNDIFFIEKHNEITISETNTNQNPFGTRLFVRKNNLPNIPHQFTVSVEKSNGEILTAKSNNIVWN